MSSHIIKCLRSLERTLKVNFPHSDIVPDTRPTYLLVIKLTAKNFDQKADHFQSVAVGTSFFQPPKLIRKYSCRLKKKEC